MKDTTVLDSLVGNASHISIVVHTHPDGDAIGSGTAMLCYLTQSRGKDAALIVPDSIPDSISFITRGAADGSILVFDEERREPPPGSTPATLSSAWTATPSPGHPGWKTR